MDTDEMVVTNTPQINDAPFYLNPEVQKLNKEERAHYIYQYHKRMNELVFNRTKSSEVDLVLCSPPQKKQRIVNNAALSNQVQVSTPRMATPNQSGLKRKLPIEDTQKSSMRRLGIRTPVSTRLEKSFEKLKEHIKEKEIKEAKVERFFKNLPENDVDDDIDINCDVPIQIRDDSNEPARTSPSKRLKLSLKTSSDEPRASTSKSCDKDNNEAANSECPICGLKFLYSEIESHASTCGLSPEEMDSSSSQITCDTCHKSFILCSEYTAHLRTCF